MQVVLVPMDLGTDYTGGTATNQAKGDALVEAIFDSRVNFEEKDVPTDNLYGVFTPEDYFFITQSSPRYQHRLQRLQRT